MCIDSYHADSDLMMVLARAALRNGQSSCVWLDLDPKLEHAAGAQLLALLKLVPGFASRDTIALTKADLESLMAKGEELMSAAEPKAKKRARAANADGAVDDAAGRIAELEARVARAIGGAPHVTAVTTVTAVTASPVRLALRTLRPLPPVPPLPRKQPPKVVY